MLVLLKVGKQAKHHQGIIFMHPLLPFQILSFYEYNRRSQTLSLDNLIFSNYIQAEKNIADHIEEMQKSKGPLWLGNPIQDYITGQMLKIEPPDVITLPLLFIAHTAPFTSKFKTLAVRVTMIYIIILQMVMKSSLKYATICKSLIAILMT